MVKRILKRTKGLIKGAPTAVLVSAAVHAAVILVAGGLVVFNVVKKQEKKFEPPPPVERPKMELKKPKVKIKKRARPKASRRIAAKSVQGMSQIQLPDSSSFGEGLGGGIGGFELMPDPSEMTLLGSSRTVAAGNDLEGTFYSLVLDRKGSRNQVSIGSPNAFGLIIRRFFESGWNPRSLSSYYRWPMKLYTSFIFLPLIPFEHVPRSFGIPDEVETTVWIVHYKGKMMAHESGRYRFRGAGNFVLSVRLDGVEVGHLGLFSLRPTITDWRPAAEQNEVYYMAKHDHYVGDWFELEEGKPVEMEVLIGDYNGADTMAALLIEKEGEFYPKAPDGAPIIPVFKTTEIPEHLKDEIRYLSIAEDQNLNSSMMFNVY